MATAGKADKKDGPKEFSFSWEGKNKAGKVVRGEIKAAGEAVANAALRRQGINVTKLKKLKASSGGKVSDKDITLFSRQLATMVKSGVPLFNAMASISSEYGEVSKEFGKIVQRINSGTPDLEALAEASTSNPSHQFRRVLWQISNALKVGSDVGRVLELQIDELTRERVDQIRRYGQELSPWTMIYMMAAVILPSLGVTMMIVVVGFLDVSVPKAVLGGVLVGLIGFQILFMNFVNSRRPAI